MTSEQYQYDTNMQLQRGRRTIPDTHSMSVPEAAATWVKAGWRPIPASIEGSVPRLPWSAVDGLSEIDTRRLFEQWPNSRLSIIVPPDVVVLDVDHRPEEHGWYAEQISEQLQKRFGLPPCPTCLTPRGGMHYWFSLPENVTARNWTAQAKRFPIDGVDIKTGRGLATIPPTCRPDGEYTWATSIRQLPMAPPSLCKALRPPPPRITLKKSRPMSDLQLSAYVAAIFANEIAAVRNSRKGGRNDQLFRSTATLAAIVAASALPEEQVREALTLAAEDSGLTRDDGANSVRATIESGFRVGFRNPRELPARRLKS
jgi:hypothetical protein